MSLDLVGTIRNHLGLHILLSRSGLLDEKGIRSARRGALIEGQAFQRRIAEPIAILHADVQVLVARLTDLQTESAARTELAAGEAHERAHGRMLGVEVDVAVEGRD